MKVDEYKETFYWYTEKASDITRHLSFAGIAIIWIFRSTYPKGPLIPKTLLLPSIFFVIALSFDLLQYLSGTTIWGLYHRKKEKQRLPKNKDIKHPFWLPSPIYIFFILKICTVIVGYIIIINFLLDKIKGP